MIDLCVVGYNSRHHLERLVENLYSDYKPGVFTISIADNGSQDGTAEWLMGLKLPNSLVIHFNDNIGYAAACNEMALFGESEYIGLLNADVWLNTSDLESIMSSFEETGADIIGPKQRDEHYRVRHGGIFGTNVFPKFRGWALYDPRDEAFRDRKEAVTVSGSAYFIRRNTWDALTNDTEYRKLVPDAKGAFLPTFFYYEETWCSYFARHRGYKVLYDGTVSIGHSWHGSHEHGDILDTKTVKESRAFFRTACDFMGIERD